MELGYKTILVAVDGSNESERAFRRAAQIAKSNDAKLLLVHIIDGRAIAAVDTYTFDSPLTDNDPTVFIKYENHARELLEKYKKEAEDAGLKDVNYYLQNGYPKELITDIANDNKVDLVVCGATGLNAFERLLIGSVSEYITRHVKCDVLLVRSQE
ncbi:universal stress protein [Bacillus benzoevorans]|uniref:Universal stress protein n=1 Tax=Bacillus benzoevorans TaxID=1456 RepID=A0A7X0HRS2_9BACI|nr:universal stress protein [Bacillus benzoevorans]MBB6444366.1 nucleotide-binding universal stress UspA family protein [Bacillus benzoevorans]